MKIAIAGSHGLIGTNLVTHFRKSNNNVSRIVRSKEQNGIYWNPVTGYICLLYTSPSPRDLSTSRMPSSA